MELTDGEIDGNLHLSESAPLPAPRLRAGGAQDPEADLVDERAAFGQWNEMAGRNEPALGMAPPDQGLGPDHPPDREIDDRLVVEEQLLFCHRPAKLLLEHEPLAPESTRGRREEGRRQGPCAAGAGQRGLKIVDEQGRIVAICRRQRHGTRNLGHHPNCTNADLGAGLLGDPSQLGSDAIGIARIVEAEGEHRLLDPGEQGSLRQRRFQPTGEAAHEGVRLRSIEAAGDRAQIGQAECAHCQCRPLGPSEAEAQMPGELVAVRQARSGIVVR